MKLVEKTISKVRKVEDVIKYPLVEKDGKWYSRELGVYVDNEGVYERNGALRARLGEPMENRIRITIYTLEQ